MVVGLRNFTDGVGDGAGQPVLDFDNGEELIHVQPHVAIVLGNHPSQSPGTLFISSKYSLSLPIPCFIFAFFLSVFLNFPKISVSPLESENDYQSEF